MEMNFDITSFILGGGAAILILHLAKLIGYIGGRIYYRVANPRPSGWICPNATTSRLALSRVTSESIAEARGKMLSGS